MSPLKKFSFVKNYEEFVTYESCKFKPIFYYLEHLNDSAICNIYCDDTLLWNIRGYGSIKYITRFFDNDVMLRCTIINRQLDGYCYLYEDGILNFILKYKNNNLHEHQIHLSQSYKVFANYGKIERSDGLNIINAHKRVLALLKWV